MRPNNLRQKLESGLPSIGTHIHSPWPTLVEIVGHSRMFDYVEFVAEYGPYDLHQLDNFGRAAGLFDHLSAMIKIEQEPRTHLAIRAIGSGFQSVLFADVRNVDDARECVKAVRAEAKGRDGVHGVGMRRDVGVVLEAGSPAFVDALDQVVVALMIEKESAVEQLEGILAVPGVDMVNFGPADYSMSLGLTGQKRHPAVLEAELYVIETAMDLGVAYRAEINSPTEADFYIELGVKHFCIGTDTVILFEWWAQNGEAVLRSLGVQPPERPAVAGYADSAVNDSDNRG